jgi:hypothetical protein
MGFSMGIAYSFNRCTPEKNNRILVPVRANTLSLAAA